MARTPEKLEQRVIELANLPTLPAILKKIAKMTESSDSSAAEVADVISTDQVLSAKVLKLVNSPVYGFPGRISSVRHAVVLLGFNVIKGLVLGTAVFGNIGKYGQGLWDHSLACALFSRRIANEIGIPDPEEIMVAGLLHDLGKVVLCVLEPDDYEEAVRIAQDEHCHIREAERRVFTADHARVAGWIAREWHFPARLSIPVTYHHRPDLAKDFTQITAVVHVANVLARAVGYGFGSTLAMPEVNHDAFNSLKLSFPQIEEIIKGVQIEFATGADLLEMGE